MLAKKVLFGAGLGVLTLAGIGAATVYSHAKNGHCKHGDLSDALEREFSALEDVFKNIYNPEAPEDLKTDEVTVPATKDDSGFYDDDDEVVLDESHLKWLAESLFEHVPYGGLVKINGLAYIVVSINGERTLAPVVE